jgi:DNA invertase Pin-like site-specific DNA recombinase
LCARPGFTWIAIDRHDSRYWRATPETEAIDTMSPTDRAIWQILGGLAELERSPIRARTAPD